MADAVTVGDVTMPDGDRTRPMPITVTTYCRASGHVCTRPHRGCIAGRDVCRHFRARTTPYASIEEMEEGGE